MLRCNIFRSLQFLIVLVSLTAGAWAQSQNASISGQVTDESGAFVPNAEVTVTSSERNSSLKVNCDSDGRYAFPNLAPGPYELSVSAPGFKTSVQSGITLVATQTVRVELVLKVGDSVQKIEVVANASQLNYDNAVRQEGVSPDTILQLPLVISGGIRDSSQFITFQPGVNTGTSQQGFNARINGGLKMGDEAIMDGVSMQEGTMAQSGTVAFADYRMTPDMVSEIRVLTSSYQPEYGTSTGGQIMATSKSGGEQFHGAAFEYLRNKDLNALQFTNKRQAGDQRPKDNENQFGFNIGGPAKIPFMPFVYGSRHKTYFFADFEFFRIVGGASRQTLNIPSASERAGNFNDWIDSKTGNIIPIYDPNSTVVTPSVDAKGNLINVVTRTQFMNNTIPTSRFSQQALLYLKYLPTPTSSGAINNYLVPQPVPDSILAGANERLIRIDHNWGDKDHVFASIWRQTTPKKFNCALPLQICSNNLSDPQDSWVSRLNWDRSISPTILNHFAYGYLNRNEGYGSINTDFTKDLPQIPGAFSHAYPPQFTFGDNKSNDFAQLGNNSGLNNGNKTTRPSHIVNDLVTFVRGSHTIKFGGEYRHLQQVFHSNSNSSGTYNFTGNSTGLLNQLSGSPVASFLLGAVDNANIHVYNIPKWGAEQSAVALHAGDTWKMNKKLSLDYGLRWDRFTPSRETSNNLSFFDFGANPDAGGRAGRLQFASDNQPYPESVWNGGFAPRIGIAYSVDSKTVVRTGYGIFYTQAFYPGWGGGLSLDGLNPNPGFSSTVSGLQPSFYLDSGFPAYVTASNRGPGADNGLNPLYRPKDSNHRSYSQQWNLTIERQLGGDTLASVAYVGSKGTRLPSQLLPLNVLNPSQLALGSKLRDSFSASSTSVDGVALPYPGWVQQLSGHCDATVAQALLPYPQYCSSLTGANENLGFSTYHSLQMKVEKRFAQGVFLNANYTWSKLITNASSTTQATANYGGIGSVISPFQLSRNKALSTDDIPSSFALLAVVDLPFGKGKKFLAGNGLLDRIVGGWSLSSTMKFTSGAPFYFRDTGSTCNVPSQFQAACIPAVLKGANPFAQSLGSYVPNVLPSGQSVPLFNASAFESNSNFQYYFGSGLRVTNYRGYGFKNVNLSLAKEIPINERMRFKFSADASNVLNNHYFTCDGSAFGDCQPFNNDLGSSNFGVWNGTVSSPRSIQLVGRFTF
jgi:hypothetical protein